MRKRKDDPSLTKIIVAICLVGGAIFGVLRFADWFGSDYVGGEVSATTHNDLNKAESLFAEGKPTEAREVLAPLLDQLDPEAPASSRAALLQARLDLSQGNRDAAKNGFKRVTETYPQSAERPEAEVAYARLLEEDGAVDQAVERYRAVVATAPPEIRAPALNGLARHALRTDNTEEARAKFGQAAEEAEWGSEAWLEAVGHLGEFNVDAIFSVAQTPESKTYRVEKGDSLTRIGVKLNTTQGLLMRANSMTNPNLLRPGQILKYTPKDFHIVIERSTCRLYLLDDEGIFKLYEVGLGKKGHATTLGRYRIGNKEKDPTWFKPGSEPIPPGDPRNELGSRWMPMVPEEEGLPDDLGIHGTIEPETVGTYASKGCPRLLNEEVEELYDLVVRSTPVTVVEDFVPEDFLGS